MKRAIACLIVAIVGLHAGAATAGDCCNDCGCQCQCCKVCRCVPEVKKVPKVTYCCEQEDFCVPGHSKFCGYKKVCPDDCDCGGWNLFHHHAHKEAIWQPTCAKVRTRNKLVKKEEMKEVCGWRWEVVYLCPHCNNCNGRCGHHSAQTQPGAEPAQALADKAAADYYSQNEDGKPIAQPAAAEESPPQKAQLASHSATSKLKQLLLPMLAK